MLVLGIIGMIVAIAVPNVLKQRTRAQTNACIENLNKIEAVKQIWGVELGKMNGAVPTDDDLFGPGRYMVTKPECPAGGVYDLGVIGQNPTCTIAGHTL
ncbi:MAG: hypothetical protein M1608_15105 [Candidatus Omnitrophica bacterium]|nr:hypothetical protein [Candidatus Omnitrophota bacterium]